MKSSSENNICICMCMYIYMVKSQVRQKSRIKKMWGAENVWPNPPKIFLFTNSEGRRLLLFKKHWMIFVRLLVFILLMKECPKKALFLAILVDNFYESFFQSHLKYISNMNMMKNCIYMFKTSLIFNKNEIKMLRKNS